MQVSPEDSPSTLKYSFGSRSGRGGGPLGPWRSSSVAGFLDRPPPPASSTNQHSIASGPAETTETTVARPGERGSGDQRAIGCPATGDRPAPSDPPWDLLPLLPSVSIPKQEEMGSAHPVPQRRAGAEASWCYDLSYQVFSSPFTFIFLLRLG
jgi:hypothetical protein